MEYGDKNNVNQGSSNFSMIHIIALFMDSTIISKDLRILLDLGGNNHSIIKRPQCYLYMSSVMNIITIIFVKKKTMYFFVAYPIRMGKGKTFHRIH